MPTSELAATLRMPSMSPSVLESSRTAGLIRAPQAHIYKRMQLARSPQIGKQPLTYEFRPLLPECICSHEQSRTIHFISIASNSHSQSISVTDIQAFPATAHVGGPPATAIERSDLRTTPVCMWGSTTCQK